jgi:hypothetical protein
VLQIFEFFIAPDSLLCTSSATQSPFVERKMSFSSLKRTYDFDFDDDSSDSLCPESPMQFPLMMTDTDGVNKFIFSEQKAKELSERVRSATNSMKEHCRKGSVLSGLSPGSRKIPVLGTGVSGGSVKPQYKKHIGIHGLAPKGMSIPKKGYAFCVGGGSGICGTPDLKKPLKESNQEKYNRIKAEQEDKKNKKDKRAVKKLKREGKLGTLAPFMFS